MARYYRIKNWDQYQHYKDRSPPWIKLHRNLLQSETWVMLDDPGRVLAIASMMLAADTENKIPANASYIRRVAYLDYDPDFSPLIELGFLEIVEDQHVRGVTICDASNTLADASTMQADARLEERRGEESKGEKRREEGGEKSPDYAFAGRIIKINHSQAKQWREAFPRIDLIAELTTADAYYSETPPKGGKWFFPVSNWLKRANEQAGPKPDKPKQTAPGKMTAAQVQELMAYNGPQSAAKNFPGDDAGKSANAKSTPHRTDDRGIQSRAGTSK